MSFPPHHHQPAQSSSSRQEIVNKSNHRPSSSISNTRGDFSYLSLDQSITLSSSQTLTPHSDRNLVSKPRPRKSSSTRPGSKNQQSRNQRTSYSISNSTRTTLPSPPSSTRFLQASQEIESESISLKNRMEEKCAARSALAQVIRHWSSAGRSRSNLTILSIALVILVKTLVSLGGYSGFGQGPLFGDLEAQRHWMGLTLHRNISEWYFYDLKYWGLDYPPLTAYHSWLLAQLGHLYNPSFVALRPPLLTDHTGWGDLHECLKLFLRFTVLGSDLILWIPVVLVYSFVVFRPQQPKLDSSTGRSSVFRSTSTLNGTTSAIYSAMLLLLNPNLILIDNGHFQYNSIMLGLTLASAVSFHLNRDLLGAALYVCSMCFKQMALYYSPAIFAYLFGKCLYLRYPTGTALFFKIAVVSIFSLAVAFLPLAIFAPFPITLLQAIHRIFPLARGLFEDKVANFWCAANVVIKFRNLADVTTLAKMALLMTVLSVLPAMMVMIWVSWTLGSRQKEQGGNPIPRTVNLLPYTLFSASMGFYLFSFQVHEKTILLPLLPLMMIMSRQHSPQQLDLNTDWEWTCLISNVACFSMFPLLKKDGLCLQYWSMMVLYNRLIGYNPFTLSHWAKIDVLALMTYLAMGLIHLGEWALAPPDRLPDLYIVLNLTLSFVIFSLSYLWGLVRLVEEAWALVGFSGGVAAIVEPTAPVNRIQRRSPPSSSSFPTRERGSEGLMYVDEEEAPRDLSKTKRATSLQARPKKSALQVLSDHEPDRARSLGGSIGARLAPLRPLTKTKAMISSPGGEKLMNRIRNRVNSEQAGVRAQNNRMLKDGVRSSLGQEVEQVWLAGPHSRMEEGDEAESSEQRSKIEVEEQDWETALRHSREGAIRRRREELRTSGGGRGKSVQLSGGGYVDALDLVNGTSSSSQR